MRVGAVQMAISDSLGINEENITCMAVEGSRRGADLLVFPEMALTGYNPEVLQAQGFRQDLDLALKRLGERASKLGLALVVGHALWEGESLYNGATALLPTGESFTYLKLNLTEAEAPHFTPGKGPVVFRYKGRTFGLMICRDQNYPLLAQKLKEMGADTLLLLSAHYYPPPEARWKLDKNRALPLARAVENSCYVVMANAVGSHLGLISLGHSLIADPEGVVVVEGDEASETILYADLR